MSLVRVGDWLFDAADGTLSSPSARKHLEPKQQAVLMLLVERRATVVSSDEIFREVWSGTHVTSTALPRTISQLRDALDDEAREPRYIETIPKRGYRLIAAVEIVADAAAPEPLAPPAVESFTRWPRSVSAIAASLALLLVVGHDAPGPARFMDHSMGTHEATLAMEEHPPGQFHPRLWHDTRLGNETAFEYYTKALARQPESVEAMSRLAMVYAFRTTYLPDTAHWVDAALDMARRASAKDPSSGLPVRAMAIAYAQAGRLKDAAAGFERAIQLSPGDWASRTNLGFTLTRAGRLSDALDVFAEQVANQPSWIHGYAYAAMALVSAGYFDEANRLAEAAIEREPLMLVAHLALIQTDLARGRYPSARTRLERLLGAHADNAAGVADLGLVEQLLGHPDEARRHYERARTMPPPNGEASLRLAQLQMRTHNRADAESLLREVEDDARAQIDAGADSPQPRWLLAAVSAVRGDQDTALRWYARAVEAGHGGATWDQREPLFESIRKAPAFTRLIDRLQLEHRAIGPLAARLVDRLPSRTLARR